MLASLHISHCSTCTALINSALARTDEDEEAPWWLGLETIFQATRVTSAFGIPLGCERDSIPPALGDSDVCRVVAYDPYGYSNYCTVHVYCTSTVQNTHVISPAASPRPSIDTYQSGRTDPSSSGKCRANAYFKTVHAPSTAGWYLVCTNYCTDTQYNST